MTSKLAAAKADRSIFTNAVADKLAAAKADRSIFTNAVAP